MEGVLHERAQVEEDGTQTREKETRKPRQEMGPFLICLDTSRSMAGTPETAAKALTLEAMRVAHSEPRRCLLFNFSGPAQVFEHDLSLSPEGLTGPLAFVIPSFHGGTDVHAVQDHGRKRHGRDDASGHGG